jgi:hypothetical protein
VTVFIFVTHQQLFNIKYKSFIISNTIPAVYICQLRLRQLLCRVCRTCSLNTLGQANNVQIPATSSVRDFNGNNLLMDQRWAFILLDLVIPTIFATNYEAPQCTIFSSFSHYIPLKFSNTFNLCSSRNERAEVSHPYKTTRKITVLCILIVKFLERSQEDNRFLNER